ncbi:hypothetical protein FBBNIHIM_13355 [Pseudocitrobacter vendiensis]|uniref:Uncharacterized protein n=1 Tax=Pseudocitrobacter vendiensis TaxID=2488306 RepID=A0ABN8TBA0_9ENTR|nr:hypothetical protein FBBNIHIM_13355 [Pseudocitrobacter vendiensis]
MIELFSLIARPDVTLSFTLRRNMLHVVRLGGGICQVIGFDERTQVVVFTVMHNVVEIDSIYRVRLTSSCLIQYLYATF